MPDLDRRVRHRQVVTPAHRLRGVARRGMRASVLAVIAGGTLAFAVATPSAPAPVPSPTADAGSTATDVDRHAAGALVASRSASRVTLEGAAVEIVVDDGEPRSLTTDATTVAEALRAADVVVDQDDLVSIPLGAAVLPGMTIDVTTVDVGVRQVTDTEEFETVEQEDDSLLRGEREVQTEGVDGVTASTYRVVHTGGDEENRELIARAVLSERVDEVVRVGTAEPEPEPEPEPAASGSSTAAEPAAEPAPTYSGGDTRAIGADLAAARGWGGGQFQCLEQLWTRESNWDPTAQNPSSGAYGIPQSLPGSKMATAGADWRTNPATQITWGLNYIAGRYGTPCSALSHSNAHNWY